MLLDPGTAALLQRLRARGEPEMFDGTVDEARARFAAGMRETAGPATRAPEVVHGPRGDGVAVPLRVHRPAGAGSGSLVLFVHGGGWVLGGGEAYDAVAARLADDTGAVVAAVDYRTAPEHPFPTPYDDTVAAARWAVAHADDLGADPRRVALAGDSAGANLAAGAALVLRDEGTALAALLLVYPPPDFEARYPSVAENAEGYWLTARDVKACSRLYLAGYDPRGDHRVSPLRAPSLAGLPPTIVATAGFDPLRDAGAAFAEALAAAGAPTTLREHPSLTHGFLGFTGEVPAADEAAAALHADLAALLG